MTDKDKLIELLNTSKLEYNIHRVNMCGISYIVELTDYYQFVFDLEGKVISNG